MKNVICSHCGEMKPPVPPNLRRTKCLDCYNAYMRQWYKKNKNKVAEKTKAYSKTPAGRRAKAVSRDNNNSKRPEKYKARYALNNAIRRGIVMKQNYCSSCLNQGRIEGHHKDYDKPLEVIWLCPQCHKTAHYDSKETCKYYESMEKA